MLFNIGRPQPRYQLGSVASILNHQREKRYFVVQRRRWVKPDGASEKQWVYDGEIFGIRDGCLYPMTYGYTYGEKSLWPISTL